MKTIRVFEHESIYTYPDKEGRSLSQKQLDRLYQFNDQNGNKYFTGIRNGVRFNSYVGVVQIGNLIIEILPKIDKPADQLNFQDRKWRDALLQMLAVCKVINIDSATDAQLAFENKSLLEIYYSEFLDELDKLLRLGLVKKYHLRSGNLYAWKGRMDFRRNLQQNLTNQERFYTHHQVYDYEHLINQILLYALFVLKGMITNSGLKDKTARLLLNFPEMKLLRIQKSHFDQIVESRKTAAYHRALQLARMIILNYSPDLISGQENMLALLFDMNMLWEEYIYRMLIKEIPSGFELIYQDNQRFWEKRTIRPDLVVRYTDENSQPQTCVIDTKWRVPLNNQPTDDELKQMYAYNMYWNASRSILLYPEVTPQQEYFGDFHKGRVDENKCKVGFVSVFDMDGSLNRSIGKSIIKKIEIK